MRGLSTLSCKALLEIAGKQGLIGSQKLGHWLWSNRDRVVDGVKIVAIEDAHLKQRKWQLAELSSGGG